MRKKYTGEKADYRKDRHAERQRHIRAILDNEVAEELPETLLPDIFSGIKEIYRKSLKSVPDPRSEGRRVYPLYLILHRVISGFIEGNKYIGVLFPTKRINTEAGKKKLGALPTRKAVYTLLRRIDRKKADEVLAPLWGCLGYTPDLIVRRKFGNPGEILQEFREEQKQAETEKRKRIREENEARERSEGMSAAKAKRSGYGNSAEVVLPKRAERVEHRKLRDRILTQYDPVIDGKAVKASYNAGVKERIVRVTEIRKDRDDNRSRFIIGAYPTETDRNGEWGAAVSISETLTPLSGDRVISVSGDAGFCVGEFCEWLNAEGFFYLFRIKKNSGNIFLRVSERASYLTERNREGDYQHVRVESDKIHSRILRRLSGLCHAVYPGIREGFVIQKTDLKSSATDTQYFITNRRRNEWDAQGILSRILLHWDTETGVFGIKDNTFCEDRVRYKSISGTMSHVSLLNFW